MLFRFVVKMFSRLNNVVYRASKGRLLNKVGKLPVLLLNTTGRKSGKRRTVPLLYVEDAGGYVVLASYGGQPSAPGWYHNLMADGAATVEIGAELIPVRAELVEGEDRERLWRLAAAGYAAYDKYRAKTARDIPVVALRPS